MYFTFFDLRKCANVEQREFKNYKLSLFIYMLQSSLQFRVMDKCVFTRARGSVPQQKQSLLCSYD